MRFSTAAFLAALCTSVSLSPPYHRVPCHRNGEQTKREIRGQESFMNVDKKWIRGSGGTQSKITSPRIASTNRGSEVTMIAMESSHRNRTSGVRAHEGRSLCPSMVACGHVSGNSVPLEPTCRKPKRCLFRQWHYGFCRHREFPPQNVCSSERNWLSRPIRLEFLMPHKSSTTGSLTYLFSSPEKSFLFFNCLFDNDVNNRLRPFLRQANSNMLNERQHFGWLRVHHTQVLRWNQSLTLSTTPQTWNDWICASWSR